MSNKKRKRKDINIITDRHYRRLRETEKMKCFTQILSSIDILHHTPIKDNILNEQKNSSLDEDNNILFEEDYNFIHTDKSFSNETLTQQILHQMLLKIIHQLLPVMKIQNVQIQNLLKKTLYLIV